MPSFTLKQAAGSQGLTCDSRPALAPCQESRGAERQPAERTLVRNHIVTRLLPGSDPFTGIGVSVVQHCESIFRIPHHSDPGPPILNARSAIEPKTDKAHAGIVPLRPEITKGSQETSITVRSADETAGKMTRRYVLAEAQLGRINVKL